LSLALRHHCYSQIAYATIRDQTADNRAITSALTSGVTSTICHLEH
jgi:hypothetical protein